MKIFWTESALEAEVTRRLYHRVSAVGATFDPEKIPNDAVRVAIAAYHRVGLPAVKEDSYFIRPMREALQVFGRHLIRGNGDWTSDPKDFIQAGYSASVPVAVVGEPAPRVWDPARLPQALRRTRGAP